LTSAQKQQLKQRNRLDKDRDRHLAHGCHLLKDMTGRVFWDKFPPKLPIWAADYKNVNDPMKK
jgi:hypothetical protein